MRKSYVLQLVVIAAVFGAMTMASTLRASLVMRSSVATADAQNFSVFCGASGTLSAGSSAYMGFSLAPQSLFTSGRLDKSLLGSRNGTSGRILTFAGFGTPAAQALAGNPSYSPSPKEFGLFASENTLSITPVPEPTTMALVIFAVLMGAVLLVRSLRQPPAKVPPVDEAGTAIIDQRWRLAVAVGGFLLLSSVLLMFCQYVPPVR